MISALEELEREWNVRAVRDPIYGQVKHPINCNPGIIRGEDWASSVPAWCDVDCRIALLPGWSVSERQREIETCVAKTAASIPFLANNPPQVVWSGYLSHGYVMREQPEVRQTLNRAYRATTRKPLSRRLATSLNDARFYDRYFNIPTFCYGPIGERIRGFNERVNLTSARNDQGTGILRC